VKSPLPFRGLEMGVGGHGVLSIFREEHLHLILLKIQAAGFSKTSVNIHHISQDHITVCVFQRHLTRSEKTNKFCNYYNYYYKTKFRSN
jgi:hypothetical protein